MREKYLIYFEINVKTKSKLSSVLGKLIGRFYDENGDPTEYNREFQKRILQADKEKQLENVDKETFPPCNVEWTADKGSRVWCTKKRCL